MKAKAHGACGAQHFVFISARYSLAHTKAAARSGDAGNTDFPLGFLLGGLCGGRIVCYFCLSLYSLAIRMERFSLSINHCFSGKYVRY